ncbi:aldose 1-epimerase family protein [Poseidonibacter antarcticus]|uniref:aldose 1-epimerase family protein n=1 Tax=Poseidonibacter antarcticus TaxID=2478538 RepID=UPI000EF51738|nr:aldose 1-epimerase family protein [Poseidonibacter antarcticus]
MIYSLENNEIKIKIDSFGAELKSLISLDENIEYLWQGDPKFWNRSSPVLFPIVGKLLDNNYDYENKEYSMSQHGFARDKEFLLVKQNKTMLKFLLKDDEDSLKIYPFVFELYITYEIKDRSLKVSYEVINKSNDKMYFSIGAHPAFNWPLEKNQEKQEDYYFEFEDFEKDSLNRFPLQENGISNNLESVNLEDKKLAISKDIFRNDALIFKNDNINIIVLKNSINKRFIEMKFEASSYLGLWSKPSGAPFVCIEPWCGIADFIDSNKKLEDKVGINILEKNDTFSSSYFIKI